jgi:hypothetical protein
MAYRNSFSNNGNSATPSVTVSGVQTDDIALITITYDDASASVDPADLPSGVVELSEADNTTDGQTQWVGYKRCAGGETGFTFGSVGSASDWICQCVLFSGRHTTNPPVVSTVSQSEAITSGTAGNVVANGVTALSGDDLAFVGLLDPHVSDPTSSFTAPTSPVTFTERQDATRAFCGATLATADNVSAGATGTVAGTATFNGTDSGYTAWLVRVPAAAAGGTTVGLTGSSGTSAAGTVVASRSFVVTGAAGTGAAGTEVPGISVPLVGQVAGTAAVGAVAVQEAVGPIGLGATGQTGILGVGTVSITLTGVGGTAAAGTVTSRTGVVIGYTALGTLTAVNGNVAAASGVSAASAIGLIVSSGGDAIATLTGIVATGAAGRVVSEVALSGLGMTASRGSIAQVFMQAGLTGVAGTSSRGTVAGVVAPGPVLTGVAASDPPGSRTVAFAWGADPTPGVTDYHIEIGTAPGLSDAYNLDVGSLATSFSASIANGIYYWRVRSYAGLIPGAASSPDQVLVVAGRLGILAPSIARALGGIGVLGLTGPLVAQNDAAAGLGGVVATAAAGTLSAASNTPVSAALSGVAAADFPGFHTVLFNWNADPTPGVTNYHVEIGTAPGLTDAYDLNVGSLATSYLATIADGAYVYRIRSYAGSTPGAASSEQAIIVSGRTGLLTPQSAYQVSGQSAVHGTGFLTPAITKALSLAPLVAQAGVVGAFAGTNATTGASGVAALSAVGTLVPSTPDLTIGLTGQQVAGAVGSVGVSAGTGATVSLSGAAAIGQTGAFTPSTPPTSLALSGAEASGAVGSVGVTIVASATIQLTGVATAAAIGSVATSVALGLAGNEIAILEAALVGGLSLIGIDLFGAISPLEADIDVALSGLGLAGRSGTLATSAKQIHSMRFTHDRLAPLVRFADDTIGVTTTEEEDQGIPV